VAEAAAGGGEKGRVRQMIRMTTMRSMIQTVGAEGDAEVEEGGVEGGGRARWFIIDCGGARRRWISRWRGWRIICSKATRRWGSGGGGGAFGFEFEFRRKYWADRECGRGRGQCGRCGIDLVV
jgi:hypothetical protein